MVGFPDQILAIWRRTISLSWPIAVQQTFNTLMRTVDIIVTGLFSPAAVAAVGLADLYAQIPLRLGLGLGTGAIALSSQDTGRNDIVTRDRAITQALIMGFLVGIPLVLVALLISPTLIALLGAEPKVVREGEIYLMLVLGVAPMRIVGLVGARSLQGTGDTTTPMVVNIITNMINILITVGAGLGIGPIPELSMVGVGLGTAVSRTVEATLITVSIISDRTTLSLSRPRDLTITRQLVAVSVPNFAEGMSTSLANFPFNALLLMFGTEVTAAYHIGRRIYQQFTGPLYRSYSTAASIVIGQTLGEGAPADARTSGIAITMLSILTLGVAGGILFAGATPIAGIFTSDPLTLEYTTVFTRIFGISMIFFGIFFPFAGCLRGAGDTWTPFYARFTGTFGFMLGFGYLTSIVLGYGLSGVYAGIVLSYAWWALVVTAGFFWGGWADKAAEMVAERADISN